MPVISRRWVRHIAQGDERSGWRVLGAVQMPLSPEDAASFIDGLVDKPGEAVPVAAG